MKVAFLLLHDFRFVGWSLSQFLRRHHFSKEYAGRVSEEGNDVILYVFHQDAESVRTIQNEGYLIKVFPVELRFPPYMRFGNSHCLEVLREIKRDRPDVVHFHNYYLWSFPYVSMWNKWNVTRTVAQYHGESDLLKPIRRLFAPSLNSTDIFLVSLDNEISYLTSNFRVPQRKILKFPNVGVDTDLFRPVSAKSDNPTLLYVGRMTSPSYNIREKSPWILLDLMQELVKLRDDVKLLMVGDGPGLSRLRNIVHRRKLSGNVIFTGYIENRDLPDLYSSSWLTCIPMQLDDIDPFWDGSLKESLSCKTPVVGFNDEVASFSDSCKRLGYLAPFGPKEAAAIVDKILEDESRLGEVGSRGRSFVLRSCSWTSLIGKLTRLYGSVLSTQEKWGV